MAGSSWLAHRPPNSHTIIISKEAMTRLTADGTPVTPDTLAKYIMSYLLNKNATTNTEGMIESDIFPVNYFPIRQVRAVPTSLCGVVAFFSPLPPWHCPRASRRHSAAGFVVATCLFAAWLPSSRRLWRRLGCPRVLVPVLTLRLVLVCVHACDALVWTLRSAPPPAAPRVPRAP